jgi:hypothetical protein
MAEKWQDDLRKGMHVGEDLVWRAKVQKLPDTANVEATGWVPQDVYFTTKRILWKPWESIPPDIPYESIGKIQVGPPGSGYFAGVKATAAGGGVIDVSSSLRSMSFQFSNAETLKYAEWVVRQGMSGAPLNRSEGVPEVHGERDPNAPPPAPTKSGCFVVTAACSLEAPEVLYLSAFRDQVLMSRSAGRTAVRLYYRLSPRLACFIGTSRVIRFIVRTGFIRPVVSMLRTIRW